jgi:ATP-dependent DNA helicase RecG
VPSKHLNLQPSEISTPASEISTPPQEILQRISALNKREHNKSKVEDIIMDLCSLKSFTAAEIAGHFQKDEPYFKRKYLSNMISEKKLRYLHPEMISHPEQAYLTNIK